MDTKINDCKDQLLVLIAKMGEEHEEKYLRDINRKSIVLNISISGEGSGLRAKQNK